MKVKVRKRKTGNSFYIIMKLRGTCHYRYKMNMHYQRMSCLLSISLYRKGKLPENTRSGCGKLSPSGTWSRHDLDSHVFHYEHWS